LLSISEKKDVDGRDIGERSDAVLRTAMPGHDGSASTSLQSISGKKDVDGRDIGERSDAVLRTAMPGHDGSASTSLQGRSETKDVDGRDKPGHDGTLRTRPHLWNRKMTPIASQF